MNYHYFSKFRGIKPKFERLTNSTQLYPSLESKKLWLLFKGDLWSGDLLMKTHYIILFLILSLLLARVGYAWVLVLSGLNGVSNIRQKPNTGT